MTVKKLRTPISEQDIADLQIGDIIYISGEIVTGRDDVHLRVAKQGKESPVELRDKVIFHAGPIMQKKEDGEYEVISVGPTTSMRMEKYEKEFIEKTGVRIIIGKGGMGEKTSNACRDNKVLHTVCPGGCAVLSAQQVEKVAGVYWLDLGMPEAMWVLHVNEFGPLVVTIDTQGRNLFEENKKRFNEIKEKELEKIFSELDYMD